MKPNLFISRVLSLLLITLSGLSLEVRAQERVFDYEQGKATDYFKFNDDGNLSEAKKTFDNNAILEYKVNKDGQYCRIVYKNGDEINLEIDLRAGIRVYDWSMKSYRPINDWYKTKVMPCISAPKSSEMRVFDVNINTRLLVADNNTIIRKASVWHDIQEELPSKDYIDISFHTYYDALYNEVTALRKTFDGYRVNYISKEPNQKSIIYDDGKIFKGKVRIIVDEGAIDKELAAFANYIPRAFAGAFSELADLNNSEAQERDYACVIGDYDSSVHGTISTIYVKTSDSWKKFGTVITDAVEKTDPYSVMDKQAWGLTCRRTIAHFKQVADKAKNKFKYYNGKLNCIFKTRTIKDGVYDPEDAAIMAMGPKIGQFFYNLVSSRTYEDDGAVLLIEDIVAVEPYEGVMLDAKDNVIDIYRGGQKLDEFDKMQAIAEEQGKINKEKERAQNAIAQKQDLTRKYGEKNTNALYAGNIITGMPEELFVIGLAGHMFKNVFTATISIQDGEDRCYDLYQFDQNTFSMKQLGFVWVIDKKVSSIVYY